MAVHLDRDHRERTRLIGTKPPRCRAVQDQQRAQKQDQARRDGRGLDQPEHGRHDGQRPADRRQQREKQDGQRDVAERHHRVGGEARAEQPGRGKNVGGRRGGIAGRDQGAARENLAPQAEDDDDEIEPAGDPGIGLRRGFCGGRRGLHESLSEVAPARP